MIFFYTHQGNFILFSCKSYKIQLGLRKVEVIKCAPSPAKKKVLALIREPVSMIRYKPSYCLMCYNFYIKMGRLLDYVRRKHLGRYKPKHILQQKRKAEGKSEMFKA